MLVESVWWKFNIIYQAQKNLRKNTHPYTNMSKLEGYRSKINVWRGKDDGRSSSRKIASLNILVINNIRDKLIILWILNRRVATNTMDAGVGGWGRGGSSNRDLFLYHKYERITSMVLYIKTVRMKMYW